MKNTATRATLNQTLLLGSLMAFILAAGVSAGGLSAREKEFQNPVFFAGYSDPDVIRDGNNYYLIASTFHFVPGIPILQSNDLVHWIMARGSSEGNVAVISVAQDVQLRVRVRGDTANYFYSIDEGKHFEPLGPSTTLTFRWWKGSRPSLFAFTTEADPGGFVDADWVRYQRLD